MSVSRKLLELGSGLGRSFSQNPGWLLLGQEVKMAPPDPRKEPYMPTSEFMFPPVLPGPTWFSGFLETVFALKAMDTDDTECGLDPHTRLSQKSPMFNLDF